jgi:esterase/lipase
MQALELRHQPSGLNSGFCHGQSSFADYVATSRDMLHRAHAGKAPAGMEKAVEGNAPFELMPQGAFSPGRSKPFRRGILLVHGLTDSPYFMRPMAEFFRNMGFRVMAVLLPGHGTQPGDLLDMRWQEWAKTVEFGAHCLAQEADEVYLGGYSAGATLAMRHSLLDSRVCGVFLFSPALRVTRRASLANLHNLYSWLRPAAKWVNIQADADIYKYESFPKNAAFQMHALIADLRARMKGGGLDIPVFAAASADDATVDATATVEFMARTRHACSRLVYYTTDTIQPLAHVDAKRVELVNSAVPAQNIVSFSHLSILLPAEDPHYGSGGEYSNCLHYYPHDMDSFTVCRSHSPDVLQGEVAGKHTPAGVMRRLTYNPHYAQLEASMREFIWNLP